MRTDDVPNNPIPVEPGSSEPIQTTEPPAQPESDAPRRKRRSGTRKPAPRKKAKAKTANRAKKAKAKKATRKTAARSRAGNKSRRKK